MNVEAVKLLGKIREKHARFGVIGLEDVGLPLVQTFLKKGFTVTGFNIDRKRVDLLNRGQSYIRHMSTAELIGFLKGNKFAAMIDFRRLREIDAIIIGVPTPLAGHGSPDLSYVLNKTITIAEHLRRGQIVILESTTYPGTSDEEMLPILEASGLRAGRDFFLAFSPEREDPGNKAFSTATPRPQGRRGAERDCLRFAKALYDQIVVRPVAVSSAKVAESTKLLEKIFRSVNIALVNELKMISDRMGIDFWEVIRAASSKPFGFTPFFPNPGLGGHCIPIDPFYLAWKAKEVDYQTKFIELADEIVREFGNDLMPSAKKYRWNLHDIELICNWEIVIHVRPEIYMSKKQNKWFTRVSLSDFTQAKQEELINGAVDSFQRIVGITPISFRAGRWSFEENTLRALERTPLKMDSSVIPGYDPVGASGFSIHGTLISALDIGFMYRLSTQDILMHGNSRIIEVPISNLPTNSTVSNQFHRSIKQRIKRSLKRSNAAKENWEQLHYGSWFIFPDVDENTAKGYLDYIAYRSNEQKIVSVVMGHSMEFTGYNGNRLDSAFETLKELKNLMGFVTTTYPNAQFTRFRSLCDRGILKEMAEP